MLNSAPGVGQARTSVQTGVQEAGEWLNGKGFGVLVNGKWNLSQQMIFVGSFKIGVFCDSVILKLHKIQPVLIVVLQEMFTN